MSHPSPSLPPKLALVGVGTAGSTGICAVPNGGCLWEAVPTLCFSFSEFQLILTVVGSIGGALILCLIIALIVLSRYGGARPFP